jgi:hypothetical protein
LPIDGRHVPPTQRLTCSILGFRSRANTDRSVDAAACILINVITLDFQLFRCFASRRPVQTDVREASSLSVGIEHIDDIIADLDQALAATTADRQSAIAAE